MKKTSLNPAKAKSLYDVVQLETVNDRLAAAIVKLLPAAEAEQERLYKLTLKYPGRDESGYLDCRHAISFAYEALAQSQR